METAKYLCEFFFGNFWHFLALCIVCLCLGHKGGSVNNVNQTREEDDK